MVNINVLGGGWVTAAGVSVLSSSQEFYPVEGDLGKLGRDLFIDQSDSRWGRLDRYSKAGLIAGAWALQDSGFELSGPAVNMAMAVSTPSGSSEVDGSYFETVLLDNGLLASPNLFAYTLPSCMLGELSIRFSLTGPEYMLMDNFADMLTGIKVGADCLSQGYDQVLAGYCNVIPGVELANGTCGFAGAVFLVLEKTKEQSKLQYNGFDLIYNKKEISDIVQLIKCLRQA